MAGLDNSFSNDKVVQWTPTDAHTNNTLHTVITYLCAFFDSSQNTECAFCAQSVKGNIYHVYDSYNDRLNGTKAK